MSVMLGDGSTALAVAEELRRMESVISVATPALNIAERLAGVESIEVTVLGGMLRGSSFGTVGPLTTAALLSMRADIAFLSPDRLDERGLVFNSMMDAEVAQTMAARADRVVVIADSSKFAPGGMAALTTWDRVDDLITERISPLTSARIQDCDVRVRVTGVVRPRTPR